MEALTLFVFNHREQETYEYLVVDGVIKKHVATIGGKFKAFDTIVEKHLLPEDLEMLLNKVDCDYIYGVKLIDTNKYGV